MAGGLIQIVTYGSQDIFLTGTPEITFFKVVYRRHTPFATESLPVNFDDPVGFGKHSSITLPKIGDLIHKMYLEITLPEMNLKRFDSSNSGQALVDATQANYDTVTNFMSVNRRSYIGALEIFQATNTLDSTKLINAVNDVFNEPGNQQTVDDFKVLLSSSLLNPFTYDEVSMHSVVSNYTSANSKDEIFNAMSVALVKSVKTQNFYFETLRGAEEALEDNLNENILFAWVDRVGHALIEEIELFIGGQKIDRQYGEWLNVWYELSANRDLQLNYFKMIGNVEKLTTFDRKVKPSYVLRVPLQFWFNRYSGLSIPLVALEYHDVRLEIKFRKLEDVSYIEKDKMIKYTETREGLFLDEVVDEMEIDFQARLLVDYIYLDGPERRRFAQSSHEYLIDQLQMLEFEDVTERRLQVVVNNFVHPSKELIWTAQKMSYTENLTGYERNRWDNYSLTDENRGNIIAFTTIDFNSYNRVPKLDGNYFNYVQPYQHHSSTPSDGVNMYSFSLFPEENQPSGGANMSRLSRVMMVFDFSEDLDLNEEPLRVRVYSRNYNILRLISGMGGLAYTFG